MVIQPLSTPLIKPIFILDTRGTRTNHNSLVDRLQWLLLTVPEMFSLKFWRRYWPEIFVVFSTGSMVLCPVSLPGETSSPGNDVFTSDTRKALCYAESVVGVFFFFSFHVISHRMFSFAIIILHGTTSFFCLKILHLIFSQSGTESKLACTCLITLCFLVCTCFLAPSAHRTQTLN